RPQHAEPEAAVARASQRWKGAQQPSRIGPAPREDGHPILGSDPVGLGGCDRRAREALELRRLITGKHRVNNSWSPALGSSPGAGESYTTTIGYRARPKAASLPLGVGTPVCVDRWPIRYTPGHTKRRRM